MQRAAFYFVLSACLRCRQGLLPVVAEACAGVDAGLALVDLLLEELSDQVADGPLHLGLGLHPVDVVGSLQSHDVKDLEGAGSGAGGQPPGLGVLAWSFS